MLSAFAGIVMDTDKASSGSSHMSAKHGCFGRARLKMVLHSTKTIAASEKESFSHVGRFYDLDQLSSH